MLQFGDYPITQNSISKSRNPRNIWDRQTQSVINSSSNQNSALVLSGASQNINATTGDFNTLTSSTIITDIVKKKTATNAQILINDNLGISDVTNGIGNFNFQFKKDAVLLSNSINFASPTITFNDNVLNINNSITSSVGYSFKNMVNYDSFLSGLVFPNINETDGSGISKNSMLIVPGNYYLNYNKNLKILEFSKYKSNYHFNDVISNNVRFVKTNYDFTTDSTNNKTLLNYGTDSKINTINSLNNLLNLEAKNIALGNGDIVLLNGQSFNPIDISNTPQGKNFNFKFADIQTPTGLNVFSIGKTKAKFNLPSVDLNVNITTNNNNIDSIPRLQFKDISSFIIGQQITPDGSSNLDFIKFQQNVDGTSGKIIFLQQIETPGQSQGVSLIQPVLDFSGNGVALFTNQLQFFSNNRKIVNFNKDFIEIEPDIKLIGASSNQNIKFYPNSLSFINGSNKNFLSFDTSANNVKIYNVLDLSSNGTISFGATLNFNSKNSIPFVIRNNSVDISCTTLNFKQPTGSFAKFNNSLTFVDTDTDLNTSKYFGFDSTSKSITLYKPMNFYGDGNINFQSSISFNTNGGQTLFRIYNDVNSNTFFDTSANLQFLNTKSVIKFPDGGTLQIQDVFGNQYIGLTNGYTQFFNPIQLVGTGQIDVTTILNINNALGINLASFSQTSLSLIGNLIFQTTGFIQVNQGSLNFQDGNADVYMGLDVNFKKVILYKPLQLAGDGNIYFQRQIQFTKIDASNNPILPAVATIANDNFNVYGNLNLAGSNSNLQFSNPEFNIVDVSGNLFMVFNGVQGSIELKFPISIPSVININGIQFSKELIISDEFKNVFARLDTSSQTMQIQKPIDLSANGNILFGDFLNFADSSGVVVNLTRTSIDTSANIIMRNASPTIKVVSGEMSVIDNSNNKYAGFNTATKTIKIYQPIDLSANGTILFGDSLKVTDSSGTIVTINRTSIDTSSNIIMRNTNPTIKVVSGEMKVIDNSNNIYAGFNTSTKTVKVYQPIDLSANGTIIFGDSLNVTDSSGIIVSINRTSIDTSSNIIMRNTSPTIKIVSGEMDVIDNSNNIYAGFNTATKTVKVYQAIDLSANGTIIFGDSLKVTDSSGIIVTINRTSIDTSSNIIMRNTSPTIKIVSGEMKVIDNSNNNYFGINTVSQSINAYKLFEMQKNMSFTQSIFYIQDSDGVNYMSFNKITKKIRFIQTLDISGGIPQPSFISNIVFNAPTSFTITDNLDRSYIICNPNTYSINLTTPVKFLEPANLSNIIFPNNTLTLSDSLNTNYLILDKPNQKVRITQPIDLQTIVFSNDILYIQDMNGNNFLGFNRLTQTINFLKPTDLSGGGGGGGGIGDASGMIFPNDTFTFSDSLNRNYLILDKPNQKVKVTQPIDLQSVLFSNNTLTFSDLSNTNYLIFDKPNQKVKVTQPIDLQNVLFSNNTLTFSDSLNTNYLIFDKPNQKVKVTQPIDLQTVLFSNDTLYIRDSNGINYMAFNKVNRTIQFIAPIDSGGVPVVSYLLRINFIAPSIFSINDNLSRIYLECDPNTYTLNLLAPINCKTDNIISYTNTLSFKNNNGWNMLKLNNSSNGSFDISANIHITMDSPKIQIQSGELAFVDISDNKYFSIDVSNQVIKINKTLDLSSNGNIVFNNDLNFISNKQNILSIKQKNNLPVISYSEKLIIQNTNTNEVYANPIIKYNIISENVNSFEKKYLAKTSIPNGTGVIQYYFRNVIDTKDEQITFKGKIVSRDLENNSASFTFEGYTKYISPTNTNILEFELNPLYTSDPNWKLNSFFIYSTDLVMEVQSNQSTTTNWVVAIESISV